MDKSAISAIKQRHNTASAGPYQVFESPLRSGIAAGDRSIALAYNPPDRRFLAHSWQDIKDLLGYVGELEDQAVDSEDVDIDVLRSRLGSTEEMLEEAHVGNEDLLARFENVCKKLKDSTGENARLEEVNKRDRVALAESLVKTTRLEKRLGEAVGSVARMKRVHVSVGAENRTLRGRYKRLTEALDPQNRAEAAALHHAEPHALYEALGGQKRMLSESRSENATLQSDLEAAKKRLGERNRRLNETKALLNDVKQRNLGPVSFVLEYDPETKQRLVNAEAAVVAAGEENAALQEELDTVKSTVRRAASGRAKACQDLRHEGRVLIAQNTVLQEELVTLKTENEDLRATFHPPQPTSSIVGALIAENATLTQQVGEVLRGNEQLKDLVQATQKTLAETTRSLDLHLVRVGSR